jgi:gluconolactonase
VRSKSMFLLAFAVASSAMLLAQERGQLQERQVTIGAIPGVIAATAKWEIAATTFENADGVTATPDGGVAWASPPTSRVSGIDKDGHPKIYFEHTNGAGAFVFGPGGKVYGVMRDKTSNNGAAPFPAFGLISPEEKVLASDYQGDKFQGAGDLIVDKKGGVYFIESRRKPFPGLYYWMNDKMTKAADGINANGITLSIDEKTLYLTNGHALTALDVQPDGSLTNAREFAKLDAEAQPDGLAIDESGRLFVAAEPPGVQVFSKDGRFLGAIPSPRSFNSLALAGPGKKWLYGVGNGAIDAQGTPHPGSPAKTIYRIETLTAGPKNRVK